MAFASLAPGSAGLNFGDVRGVNPVLLCQDALTFSASADSSNISVRKSSIPMIKAVVMAALDACVFVVVCLGSYAQMRWINTRRVVACVKNYLPLRNLADEVLIRVSMSANWLFSWEQKDSVSIAMCGALPEPAPVSLLDAGFKNVLRSQDRQLFQRPSVTAFVVAGATQLSSDSLRCAAINAEDSSSTLVGHGSSLMVDEEQIIWRDHGGGK